MLGSFRAMLGATAQSPAMLFYLDNFQSQAPEGSPVLAAPNNHGSPTCAGSPNRRSSGPGRFVLHQVRPGQIDGRRRTLPRPPQRQRPGLNENYARELMELHTLGVDGGYTQADVVALARILTGWTIDRPQQGGQFLFRPQTHDAGEKVLLGTRFPAGKGQEEGERALDLLAQHPATAKHIAFKLAQRFVADEPPAELVDRAAKKFRDTKGDLREVTKLIITSPEFFADGAYRAKVKTPLEFVASAARAVNANVQNAQSDDPGAADRPGHAALRLPAADRLQHDGRRLGEYRRAAQQDELRRAVARGRLPAARGAWTDAADSRAPPAGQPKRPNAACAARTARPASDAPGQLARAPIQVDTARARTRHDRSVARPGHSHDSRRRRVGRDARDPRPRRKPADTAGPRARIAGVSETIDIGRALGTRH